MVFMKATEATLIFSSLQIFRHWEWERIFSVRMWYMFCIWNCDLEKQNIEFDSVCVLVLCNTFFSWCVWKEFRVPPSAWELRKKWFLWHAVVLFLTRNSVKDVFFVPVCYCAAIHNDLSRYYLDERHCSCRDRYNQDDT